MTKSKKMISLTVVILLLVSLPALLLIGGHLYNNALLSGVENDLIDTISKGNVEVLDSQAVCGKLNGNGNGMAFFAAVLVKGSDEDVRAALEALTGQYREMGYFPQTDARIDADLLQHVSLSYSYEDFADGEYYTVYIYDAGLNSFPLDVRGH